MDEGNDKDLSGELNDIRRRRSSSLKKKTKIFIVSSVDNFPDELRRIFKRKFCSLSKSLWSIKSREIEKNATNNKKKYKTNSLRLARSHFPVFVTSGYIITTSVLFLLFVEKVINKTTFALKFVLLTWADFSISKYKRKFDRRHSCKLNQSVSFVNFASKVQSEQLICSFWLYFRSHW